VLRKLKYTSRLFFLFGSAHVPLQTQDSFARTQVCCDSTLATLANVIEQDSSDGPMPDSDLVLDTVCDDVIYLLCEYFNKYAGT
jgi:hypothetical protein